MKKLYLIILIACCAFSYQQGTENAKVITKEVMVYQKVPVFQRVKAGKYYGAQIDRLAAAIPQTALTPRGKD